MHRNEIIRALVLLLIAIITPKLAFGGDITIERNQNINRPPILDNKSTKVYIYFDGSQKMTQILYEKLRAKGVNVVLEESQADEKFKLTGIFSITGAGKQSVKGQLSDLFETSVKLDSHQGADYRAQTITLTQLAATSAINGSISVSDMVLWLSQKAGIAGRFNEGLTGDPRGFCWHEDCNKVTSTAIISVRGNKSHWWIEESAKSEKIVIDLVIADLIDNSLKPIVTASHQVGAN